MYFNPPPSMYLATRTVLLSTYVVGTFKFVTSTTRTDPCCEEFDVMLWLGATSVHSKDVSMPSVIKSLGILCDSCENFHPHVLHLQKYDLFVGAIRH